MAKRKPNARLTAQAVIEAEQIAAAKAAATAKRNRLLKLQIKMLDQQHTALAAFRPYKFVHLTSRRGYLRPTNEPCIHYALVFDTWSTLPDFQGSDPDAEDFINDTNDSLLHGEHTENYVGTDSPDYILDNLEEFIKDIDAAVKVEIEKAERKANALKKARDLLAPEELAALGIPSG